MFDPLFAATPELDIPKIRNLRKGENIEFRELGIPNVFLSGTGLRVAEFADGSRSVVLPPREILEIYEIFAFAELVTCDCGKLDNAEVYFLRRMMGMTQRQFADSLGLARETISRLENDKERTTTTNAMAIQRLCMPKVIEFLNRLPASIRSLNRANFARILDLLTRKHPESFYVAKNIQITLTYSMRERAQA